MASLKAHKIRCLQTISFGALIKEMECRTSSTSADASEGTSAAASILFIRMCVTQLLCHGAISQPDLNVGQISPVRAWGQWDVTHSTFNQSTHVLRAQIMLIPAMQITEKNDVDKIKFLTTPPPCRCGLWEWAGTVCLWSASGTRTEARRCRKSPRQTHRCGSQADQTWCLWLWWFCRFHHFLCWKTRFSFVFYLKIHNKEQKSEGLHYRVTLLTNFLSSTTTFREQALGANTCKGSGYRGSSSPGAAARIIALRRVWATPYWPA